jgi:hypothetical protein
MKFKNILWILLAISFAFNSGAYILTVTYLNSYNLVELNGFMANIFEYSFLLGAAPCILAYVLIYLMQKHVLKIAAKYSIWRRRILKGSIPVITFILFGMDFFHDLFLIHFNINVFSELQYILIFH